VNEKKSTAKYARRGSFCADRALRINIAAAMILLHETETRPANKGNQHPLRGEESTQIMVVIPIELPMLDMTVSLTW
jgi:hypothetical protein